jgi:poly(A) polymerase
VLWSDVRDGWAQRLSQKQHPFPALQDAIDDVFNARIGDVSGRGKLGADMREIWMMQPRFEKRTGNSPFALVEQARFRASFDFMRLRADVGEVDVVLADWWQEFSQASDAVREDLVAQLREEQHKGARRVRAPKPPAPAPARPQADGEREAGASAQGGAARLPSAFADDAATAGSTEGGEAPRKRRRRRRKPSGEVAGDGAGDGAGGSAPPAGDSQD